MFCKKYTVVFASIFSIVVALNGSVSLSDAEKVFYKGHPNEFAMKTFLNDPQEKLLSPLRLLLGTAAFLVPASLSIMCTEAPRQNHFLSDDDFHRTRNLIIAGLVGTFFLWLYAKMSKSYVEKETFKTILEHYHSDVQQLDSDNVKLYLPADLVATFDVMFQEYQKQGEDYLSSDECKALAKGIRESIIKNNPTWLDRKTNLISVVIISFTAIIIGVMSVFAFNKMHHSLRVLQQNIDYWGIRRPAFGMFEGPRQRI